MPIRITAVLCLLLVSLSLPTAASQRLSNTQYQFLEAVRKGQVQKARDLLELANLNPNNFDGQPFVRWLFEGDGQLNAMTDEAFDFTFKELKQPFNGPNGRGGHATTFALFCTNTGAGSYSQQPSIGGLQRTQRRITFAIGQGANAKHVPGLTWAYRQYQPLPRCVDEYFSWRHNPQARSILLAVIDTLLKAGADPQYDLPIARAAEKYDLQLLEALIDNGARTDHIFPVTHDVDTTCNRHGLPPNSIMAAIPNPRDQDIALARPFLEALQEVGVDIMEKQNFVRFSAMKCPRQHVTLVERALAFGNTAYAKMVLDLSKKRPQSAAVATPPLASPVTTGSIPTGSRVVTSSSHVRQKPALDGELLSTLGPNAVFEIEEASADGQWTRINAPPVVRGWANTAVILRSSTSNTPR